MKVDTGLTIKNHLTERHSEIDDFRERVHTTFGAPLKRTVLHKEKNVELTVTSNWQKHVHKLDLNKSVGKLSRLEGDPRHIKLYNRRKETSPVGDPLFGLSMHIIRKKPWMA